MGRPSKRAMFFEGPRRIFHHSPRIVDLQDGERLAAVLSRREPPAGIDSEASYDFVTDRACDARSVAPVQHAGYPGSGELLQATRPYFLNSRAMPCRISDSATVSSPRRSAIRQA